MEDIKLPEGWLTRQIKESQKFWDSLGPVAQVFLEPLRHLNDGLKAQEPELPKEKQ